LETGACVLDRFNLGIDSSLGTHKVRDGCDGDPLAASAVQQACVPDCRRRPDGWPYAVDPVDGGNTGQSMGEVVTGKAGCAMAARRVGTRCPGQPCLQAHPPRRTTTC